jgi:hypothetical protein
METLEEVLAHHGVKGMKWGVRRTEGEAKEPVPVSVVAPAGRRVRTSGGQHHPASEDARAAAVSRRVAKKSSVEALSNKDLQALVKRMQLEQQLSDLSAKRNVGLIGAGKSFVKSMLGVGKTANEVAAFKNSPVGQGIGEKLNKNSDK